MTRDPVRLEVFQQILSAICDESGVALQRSAISPNIRERRDFSVALFDASAQLVAQAAHIPVHLGSAGDAVRAAQQAFALNRGDVVVLNDPYAGGTHLPDVTLVRPIFFGARAAPSFFLVNRAHHADIGGSVPGSMGVGGDLIAEGLVIPPIKLRAAGALQRDVLALIARNVRGANERMIDLRAQESSLALGERRLAALVAEQGLGAVQRESERLIGYTTRLARATIAGIPAGTFCSADELEDDGAGTRHLAIRLRLVVRRGNLHFDFRGTAPAARGSVNANRSIVLAACVYALRCLCGGRVPTNEGLFRVITIRTEPGSLVDPPCGAPVAAGNVETSQRLVDVCLAALAQAVPDRIPAASAGTMTSVSLGGTGPRGSYAFYETLPGGAGASARRPGCSAVQTHMTNTRNTPVEAMELAWPVRVRQLDIRRGSGGRGVRAGGDGVVKHYELLAAATVSLLAERHERGPAGARGAGRGAPGGAHVVMAGRRRKLAAKGSWQLEAGDQFVVLTPGGGGHGRR